MKSELERIESELQEMYKKREEVKVQCDQFMSSMMLEWLEREIIERMTFEVPGQRAPEAPLRQAIESAMRATGTETFDQRFKQIQKLIAG